MIFRNHEGAFASPVGMVCNRSFYLLSNLLSDISNSAAITGDAFNNLSDAGTPLLTLTGLKKSSKLSCQRVL